MLPVEKSPLLSRAAAARGFALFAVAGAAALAVAGILGWMQKDDLGRFLHAYLTSYCYYLSIALGALFFVVLQHATRAGWSVTVRRLAELLAAALPMLAVLSLPLLVPLALGNKSLYPWSDPAVVAGDELLQHKHVYLNVWFFVARCLGYVVIWSLLARYFLLRSVQQDLDGDPALTRRMERASPAALLLFAATVTFAAFDLLMSLEPDWFSTIYGLYYYAGAVVGGLAAIILMAMLVQALGRLRTAVTVEHYHDLGKLLFAFVVFWGYMAFSQYLLIWYANTPEEKVYYNLRTAGPWGGVSLVLLFANLFIPFFGLLPRGVKRCKLSLGFWAAWLLVVHLIDVFWLVKPNLDHGHLPVGLVEVCCLAGLGCLFVAAVLQVAAHCALLPLGDPRLAESLAFENS